MRRRRLALVIAGGAAVAVAAATFSGPAAAGGPGTWTKLSSGSLSNIDEVSVARYGHDLQVVWSESGGTKDRLRTRIINANGTLKTANLPVLSPWSAFDQYTVLLGSATSRVLVFSGIQDTNTGNPYSAGAMYYATSSDGKTWHLSSGSLSHSTSAYGSYGTGAVLDNNTPVVAFAISPNSFITYHRGYSPTTIPASTPDKNTASSGACCVYFTGVGKDPQSGKVWVVWYSNSGKKGKDGVDAQAVFPTAGSLTHGPSSSISSNGSISSLAPDQPLSAVARPKAAGGGVYTAYAIGYPTAHKVGVWRLGTGKVALAISTHYSVGQVGLAAAPGGRLWIFWRDKTSGKLHATRTNPGATRIGAVRTISPPGGHTVWSQTGNGANGRLDLVAVAGDANVQVFHTQVLAGLSGRVSPGTVAPGGTITVTVTDAGVPVKGATVHYGTRSKTTNASGKASFTVPRNTGSGKKRVTFTKSGYARGSATFRVS